MSAWPIARNERVRNLSYGEQKLLTVARVLATGAELLLLDEPASGLSAGALDNIMALLRRLQTEGKTLLVVEHNTRVVQQIADDVLFLHQGHLMAQGTPQQIISRSRAGGNLFRRRDLMTLRLSGTRPLATGRRP